MSNEQTKFHSQLQIDILDALARPGRSYIRSLNTNQAMRAFEEDRRRVAAGIKPNLPQVELLPSEKYTMIILPENCFERIKNRLLDAPLSNRETLANVFNAALDDEAMPEKVKQRMDQVAAVHALCAILRQNGNSANARQTWANYVSSQAADGGDGAQACSGESAQSSSGDEFIAPTILPPGSHPIQSQGGRDRDPREFNVS